ncbi:MAG: sensor domain-containing diguanylate cyclase [Synechococcales bacterium]|nr:sensor domain-containing diguanylate cyclase [Synechococcales bacterium]
MVSTYPRLAVSMTSMRQQLYPTLRAIAQRASTVDVLLRQTLGLLAKVYGAEGVLWVEKPPVAIGVGRAYATEAASRWCDLGNGLPNVWQEGSHGSPRENSPEDSRTLEAVEGAVALLPTRRFRPQGVPEWLERQRRSPQTIQLENGNLIVPILSLKAPVAMSRGSEATTAVDALAADSFPPLDLQFVLQLHRPQNSDGAAWSAEEIASLEAVASQILLICDTVRLRQTLDHAQRRAALVGRISHLLNSVLHPDDVVRRILAELGQTIRCDRCLIVDLRHDDATVISLWNRPRQPLRPLDLAHHSPALWRDAIDLVLQGAASYLELDLSGRSPEKTSNGALSGPQGQADAQSADPFRPECGSLEDWLAACGAQSALMVPVFIQEDYFGMIVLLSHRADRVYPIDELQLAGQIADQVAIALKAARHYPISTAHSNLLQRSYTLRPLNDLEDSLTLLLTRPSLEQEIEHLSTKAMQATHEPFSVMLCDLDYFKLVNDTYGAAVGDEVLKQFAKQLQGHLRRGTPLYRYGGEEFAVLLPETVLSEAVNVAERLRRMIRSQALPTTAGELEVTASFGVAQQDVAQDTRGEDVLRRAEMALSNAKRRGRDRVEAIFPLGAQR